MPPTSVSISSLVEGVLTYTAGELSPDFILADSMTTFEIVESVHDWYRDRHEPPIAREKYGKVGLDIAGAIVVRDDGVPRGHVRFENYSSPDNPHLNGVWKLRYR